MYKAVDPRVSFPKLEEEYPDPVPKARRTEDKRKSINQKFVEVLWCEVNKNKLQNKGGTPHYQQIEVDDVAEQPVL
ncbi:hypothetical protein FACS1894140_7010 [Spirochaetia bacterium]|nr:hypothetical protein FACS1894140_7010 [Spirochaetia bacterium]